MSKKLEVAGSNVLTKQLFDQNLDLLVKEDKTPLTVKDVLIAALAVADSKHEDKLERWEAIKALKADEFKDEHRELARKWVAKSVPSPVVCGQVLEAI